MSFVFRPAKRVNTPLIVGIGGPTKSGKTYSALRLAMGLAAGGTVAMLNAEGPRGEQYADKFNYVNCNIERPYSPERFTEALLAMAALKPAVGIIDSASHMHDGPGGLLEYHAAELDRMAGPTDYKKRDKCNFTAWIKPKAAENKFIYTMLEVGFPIILCFRAKEKIKIVPGKEPLDLGWQPIAGERITFETIFTLMLPPHSKGVPDLDQSEMRDPFDKMVPNGKPIDEALGKRLTEWAKGGSNSSGASNPAQPETSIQKGAPSQTPIFTQAGSTTLADDDDWMDINTMASDARVDMKRVREHITGTMGFSKASDLTRARLGEVTAWIKAKAA